MDTLDRVGHCVSWSMVSEAFGRDSSLNDTFWPHRYHVGCLGVAMCQPWAGSGYLEALVSLPRA